MATKKISELPLITTLSGSQVDGGSVLPVVVGGTTNQISVENFSRFATAYSATTASNNFLGTQNITGNVSITGVETVTGTLNVVGGGSVSGDFSVGGKLTVQELHTEVTSASVLFESGSTILGNTADDTHTVTGTILLNGQALGTGQLNAYTGSLISQTTLLSTFTTSINLATASLNLQTGSQDLVNRRISSTTGSINTTTSSFDNVFLRISSTTGSINTTTSSFNSVFLGISSVTGAMNTQSSSQDLVNLGISTYTGSQNIINSSVDSHILKQASQTGSQDLVNLGISSVTGSLIGITNGLMAFTSALDNTYATDAQLYQLYQATASIQAFTSSQDSRNFTISQITSSIDAHILKQAIQTGSQDLVNLGVSSVTGSLIGITNGLMAFTAALDSTYATDAQLYQLYAETASMKGEIAGIESYTASLKAAAIVSSSTQISNYYKFAETASANTTFYGNVIGQGNIQANKFVFTDGVVAQNAGGQNIIGTSGNILYLYTGASGLYINNQANNAQNVTITDAGVVTTRGGVQIGSSGNDQNLVFGGTNSSIYWGVGGPARMYYNVGDIKISSNGATDVLTVKNIGGVEISGGITGSLMATNGVISGSVQLHEIAGIEAYTASLKGAIEVSGQDVNVLGMITAQQFNVTYVSSSVMYQSGSNKFGNSSDDKHEFTGSLDLLGSAGGGVRLRHSNGTNIGEFVELSGVQGAGLTLKNSSGTQNILLNAGGDSYINGGNLGLGITPSAWGTGFTKYALQIGATAAIYTNTFNNSSHFSSNNYDDGSGNLRYIANGYATIYSQDSGTHKWRVAASGTAGNVATLKEVLSLSNSGQLTNTVSGSNGQFILYQQQASYNTDAMSYFHNNANASTSWNFLKMFSGYPDNTQDVEFVFRGDGNGYADTGWTTPASDYAEYFESLNGEALSVGSTVVLVGNKIRVATESDTNIIGVIRPKGAALFLGNNEAQKWNGKYLKDDYGAYILDENGHRTLNPNYDSELTYVSRENRVEWNVVGLIGQIPITKGQVVNPNWIKMKDISSNVEEWLVK